MCLRTAMLASRDTIAARGERRRNRSLATDGQQAAPGLPIPRGPPPLPLVGNLLDVCGTASRGLPGPPDGGLHLHLARLVERHGGLFTIELPSGFMGQPLGKFGGPTAVLADPKLLEEMFARQDLFQKRLFKYSKYRRKRTNGLFTMDDDEPEYHSAARMVRQAFSSKGIERYLPDVLETTDLLIEQVYKLGSGGDAAIDMKKLATKYTFDIIGKVIFGKDFGSLNGSCGFKDSFADVNDALIRMGSGATQFFESTRLLKAVLSGALFKLVGGVDRILEGVEGHVRDSEAELGLDRCPISGAAAAGGECPFSASQSRRDLVSRLLIAPDPQTGKPLPREQLLAHLTTLLFAGHDSTSAAITMLLYHVASHPEVERRVYGEVMSVVGDGPITLKALGHLVYCKQVIKENLRLFSPAQQYVRTSPPDREVSLGPYRIPPGTSLFCSTWALHRNPRVYSDPARFDPDRWSAEQAAARSPYAWLPFAAGARECVGRQLSMLEQQMCLAALCRRFHIRVDPATSINVKRAVFLDPTGAWLRCAPRASPGVERPLSTFAAASPRDDDERARTPEEELCRVCEQGSALSDKRLEVFFGSNSGACEEMATQVAALGRSMGMAVDVHPLDQLASGMTLPTSAEGAVVVVTSVYNGKPPDNARLFDFWLASPAAGAHLKGTSFCVFGVGNRQWAATYMEFPRKVRERLELHGGVELAPMGEGDFDGGDVDLHFAQWRTSVAVALMRSYGVEIPQSLIQDMFPAPPIYRVLVHMGARAKDESKEYLACAALVGSRAFLTRACCNLELVTSPERSTRHIELELPDGVSYSAGDHVGVMGANPDSVVFAYMDRLGLARDAVVQLEPHQGKGQSMVPLGKPIGAFFALAYHFDLQRTVTRSQVLALSKLAADPVEARKLQHLAECGHGPEVCPMSTQFQTYALSARRTLLEVLDEHPSVDVSIGALLGMLAPTKPRFYSVASSPKQSPGRAAICVSVVSGTSATGRLHQGLCSNFLREQTSARPFPPTVIPWQAPNRGRSSMPLAAFINRACSSFRLPREDVPVVMVGPGTGVAPMRGFVQDRLADGRLDNTLFFGCRDEGEFLYRGELEAWERSGALRLLVAFSRRDGKYVQDLLLQHSALVAEKVRRGAVLYVCGDASRMAPAVRCAIGRALAAEGLGEDSVDRLQSAGRYCEDVWAAPSPSDEGANGAAPTLLTTKRGGEWKSHP